MLLQGTGELLYGFPDAGRDSYPSILEHSKLNGGVCGCGSLSWSTNCGMERDRLDIWCPVAGDSSDESKYMWILIDDYSQCITAHFLNISVILSVYNIFDPRETGNE
ncbi:hypothetical protein AVEN_175787-1 [Araneus ventricosus]|uniref:Uncharacterized protein n=1 Tax=Araneus ventricosus TaxID=182803 RepID=A0A4Y2NSI4_ARAVE|nr:hypothetical protein AVEN_175787-1 [Araneus ventricosus]